MPQSTVDHMDAGPDPAIFTIPPEAPFLDTLTHAILSGCLPHGHGSPPGALDIADFTIYLPTRRACRGLRDALLRAAPSGALLLPRIRPLGDVDEDLGLIARVGEESEAEDEPSADDLPPAVPPVERLLTLTALVQGWLSAQGRSAPDETGYWSTSAAQASELALELMNLIDVAQLEQVDLSSLERLVPDGFAEYWQRTLRFLQIVTEQWPRHLAEHGMIDPVARRNRLVENEARRLLAGPHASPVIIAGSTGSIPATATLMKAVLSLPRGAIVLPGLDLSLDEESWTDCLPNHPEHPQYGLKQLLDRLALTRDQVRELKPGDAPARLGTSRRMRLVSEALRPADSTERWPEFIASADRDEIAQSLRDVSLIVAPSTQDEAEAISLIMRETIETPDKTAALVTPDRSLARRVCGLLQKWGLHVEDSAGQPLSNTRVGRFLELIAHVAIEGDPVLLLALLKHPLSRLGCAPDELAASVRALELTALRQPWCATGIDALADAIAHSRVALGESGLEPAALLGLDEAGWHGAEQLAEKLRQAFEPLTALAQGDVRAALRDYVFAHRQTAENLARDEQGAADSLWMGDEGQAMLEVLSALAGELSSPIEPAVTPKEYPALYRTLLHREAVRSSAPAHPRLFIWGPLEARLQQPDLMILGGLNEGAWPRSVDPGPWLNRSMREALGLPVPERLVGLSAHDFAQALGAREIVLTRAQKVDGVPSVPCRWVVRLMALLDGLDLAHALEPQKPWLGWAVARNHVAQTERMEPPAPCPPVAVRPRKLSVSDVERWIANPYAIYARHILGLTSLNPLAGEPDERHRGEIIHTALSRFAHRFPDMLPDDPAAELVAIADELIRELGEHPHVAAFWRPRFVRFAQWFAETEPERRAEVVRILTETPGHVMLEGPKGPFRLTARADRIDVLNDGRLAIYDYKSGRIDHRVRSAMRMQAPQLPLEGLIARSGGFARLPEVAGKLRIARLAYISARGGEPSGEEKPLDNVDDLIDTARAGLLQLIAHYDDERTPYSALRRPIFHNLWQYDDYAHLARFREWTGGGEAE